MKSFSEKIWRNFKMMFWVQMIAVFALIFLLFMFLYMHEEGRVKFADLTSRLSLIVTIIAAIFTLFNLFMQQFAITQSVRPNLRLFIKYENDEIIFVLENIGDGVLYLKGSIYDFFCKYGGLRSKVIDFCKVNKYKIKYLNVEPLTSNILPKGEKLILFKIYDVRKVDKGLFYEISSYKFEIEFSDLYGNTYKEKIEPKYYIYEVQNKEITCQQA